MSSDRGNGEPKKGVGGTTVYIYYYYGIYIYIHMVVLYVAFQLPCHLQISLSFIKYLQMVGFPVAMFEYTEGKSSPPK